MSLFTGLKPISTCQRHVLGCYYGVLHREPEQKGFKDHLYDCQQGRTFLDTVDVFKFSNEAQNKPGTKVYQVCYRSENLQTDFHLSKDLSIPFSALVYTLCHCRAASNKTQLGLTLARHRLDINNQILLLSSAKTDLILCVAVLLPNFIVPGVSKKGIQS